MKNLLSAFVILTQTLNLLGQTSSSNGILSISEIDQATFEKSKEIVEPSVNSNLVKKENGEINIPNKHRSGTFVTFTDDTRPEENRVQNDYLGFYNSINRHLIRTQYYEGSEFVLIGNYNNKTTIWSVPIFSKDNKYFLSFKSYGLEGEPVGVQIWEIDNKSYSRDKVGLKKILELNQLLFNPIEFRWDLNNSILIIGQVLKNHWYPTKDSEIRYWKLSFD
jgi:hypothetical protein